MILGEEKFLSGQLDEPYKAYLRTVPRFIPRLRTTLSTLACKPQWLTALITEINPIGVFLIIACLSWSYGNWLMVRAILVTLGVSLVVRALLPAAKSRPPNRRGARSALNGLQAAQMRPLESVRNLSP